MPTLFLKATRHATPSGGYFATQTTFITRLSIYGTPRRLITQVSRVFASILFDNNFVLHFVKTQAGDHPVYECLLPPCTWEPPPMDAALKYSDHATDRFYETVVLPLMIELMLTSGWQLSGSSTHRISDTESMESYIFFRADVPAEAKPRTISMPPEVPLPTEVLNSTHLQPTARKSIESANPGTAADPDDDDEPHSFIPPNVPLLSSNQSR